MSDTPLNQCLKFLSEILNNKSESLNSAHLTKFVYTINQILNLTEYDLKVEVKPFGKNCLHCRAYISSASLSNAIGL